MIIKNGMIHDAIHEEAYQADILVQNGKIAAIGANLAAENEEVVRAFLENHPEFSLDPFTLTDTVSCEGMLTLLPCDSVLGCQTDGFFIARMVKKNG